MIVGGQEVPWFTFALTPRRAKHPYFVIGAGVGGVAALTNLAGGKGVAFFVRALNVHPDALYIRGRYGLARVA